MACDLVGINNREPGCKQCRAKPATLSVRMDAQSLEIPNWLVWKRPFQSSARSGEPRERAVRRLPLAAMRASSAPCAAGSTETGQVVAIARPQPGDHPDTHRRVCHKWRHLAQRRFETGGGTDCGPAGRGLGT